MVTVATAVQERRRSTREASHHVLETWEIDPSRGRIVGTRRWMFYNPGETSVSVEALRSDVFFAQEQVSPDFTLLDVRDAASAASCLLDVADEGLLTRVTWLLPNGGQLDGQSQIVCLMTYESSYDPLVLSHRFTPDSVVDYELVVNAPRSLPGYFDGASIEGAGPHTCDGLRVAFGPEVVGANRPFEMRIEIARPQVRGIPAAAVAVSAVECFLQGDRVA